MRPVSRPLKTPIQTLLVRAAVAVLAPVLFLVACSSSGGSGAPNSSASGSPSAAGRTASAAVTAAVSKAYRTFFDYRTPLAASERVLQLGPQFVSVLRAQAADAAKRKTSAKVTKVVMQSPHVAQVTWTLLQNGQPLLPNSSGLAVLEGGTWKVAAKTFCGLLQLQGGTVPKACSNPAVTSPSP